MRDREATTHMPHVVASDGARIVYDAAGEGRPLLLVHGWATHGGFFSPQIAGLPDRFRVISVDLRGHGRSHREGDRPNVRQLADDLRTLADSLDLTGMLAVGWSMGAMVLWQALLDGMRDRTAGMVVVDMSPKVVNGPDWMYGLRGSSPGRSTNQAAEIMRADWPTVSRRASQRIFAHGHEGEHAKLKQWAAAEIGSADADAMAALWVSLSGMDFRAELRRLDLPALIAFGTRSRLYAPETAAELQGLLPRASIIAFEHSGHAPHLEEPARFNSTLIQFAAELPPPARGTSKAA